MTEKAGNISEGDKLTVFSRRIILCKWGATGGKQSNCYIVNDQNAHI